jgi:DHA1 family tetracycline resistance protein-like MFS transporter
MTRDLKIISLSLLLWGLGEGMFIYLQPVYLKQLGANPVQIGWMIGLSGLAFTISHLPAGALADIVGRKLIIVMAWIGGTLAGFIMFVASTLPMFLIGFFMYSFTGFVLSPLQSYVTYAKGSWSLTRALTTTQVFISVGSVIGPVIGGALGELWGIRMIYGIATGIFLLSSTFILLLHSQPIEEANEGPRYQSLLKNKKLGAFLLLIFFVLFAMYLSWPLTPVFLQEERGITVGTLGLLGSLYASGMVIFNLFLGRSNPRLGFLIVQITVGFSVLAIWKGANTLLFSLGYFLAAGFRVTRSLISAQVERLVNKIELGLAFGFSETVNGTVLLIASPFAGMLYDISPELPFIISLGLLAISLIISMRFIPRFAPTGSIMMAAETTND